MNLACRSAAFIILIMICSFVGAFAQEESASTPEATPTPPPRELKPATVIATVNGTPVTQAQLELNYLQYMTFYGAEMEPDNQAAFQEQASRQALALALKGGLIRHLGAERGLAPTSVQIEATRHQLHTIMGLETEAQFQELISKRGIPPAEIDTYIKTHLVNLALFEAHTKDNPTTITTTMAKLFYDRNPELHHRPQMAQMSQIVILAAGLNAADKAARRAKAEEVLATLREGANFAETAAAVSDDPAGKQGGSYGWVKRDDLQPALAEAVFALEPGQISGIVETETGFHIVKVDGRRADEDLSFERVAPVLIPKMKTQLEKSKYQDWLDLLIKDAEIVDMLKPSEE